MESITKRIRWGVAVAFLVLSAIALTRNWIDSCTTIVTVIAGDKETITTCAPLDLNSGILLVGVLLLLVLLWPDLSEIGAFGVSMKRKVEAAEEKAEAAQEAAVTLGNKIDLQALRIDTAVASASTASASATVPIMIGDAELTHAVQGLEAKIDAFISGSSMPTEPYRKRDDAQNALRVELLENAEWLRDAFPAIYGGSRRLQPDPRRVQSAEEKTRIARFLDVFSDEFEIVRAARNAVAHAQPLTDEELRKAVEISQRLRDVAERGIA